MLGVSADADRPRGGLRRAGGGAQTAPPAGHRTIQHGRAVDSLPRDLRFRRLTTEHGLCRTCRRHRAGSPRLHVVRHRRGSQPLRRQLFHSPGDPDALPNISRGFVGALFEDDQEISGSARIPASTSSTPRRSAAPATSTTRTTPTASAATRLRASPPIVAVTCGSPPWIAGWTGSTRRRTRSRTTGTTAPVSCSVDQARKRRLTGGDLVRR